MLRNRSRTPEVVPSPRARPLGVRLPLLFVVFAAVLVLTARLAGAAAGSAVPGLLVGVGCAAAALGLYGVLVGRLERRRVGEVALSGAGRWLGRGTALGLGVFTLAIAVVAVLGGYRVTGWGSVEGAFGTLGLVTAVAVVEELLFRGVVFRLVEELAGTWGALVVSGLLFGGLHLLNPGATVWGALAIAVEAGGMLAAAYAATRSLWLPIGLHLGWNLAEGGIFGTAVSGAEHGGGSLLLGAVEGPVLLTGGGFGPEASLPAVLVCLALTALLIRWARRSGGVRPRRTAARVASPTL
ncbi:Abortive infection protein [Kineococcus radiotolerans SRS30216 = ATCC BAA-149]|uniref:Abortive infection protein n=1 Tax=Kineococcus radiotolerans (strain ATCC BAA-149 / DSM 14245 / SRS30216) TaxID=266940 RepID=A6WFU3_KINRD|nr:type II CAAX endopeptidase family protein [Kineococcus radiotolerans]ABS05682.1 Abortive infection protein [Kineococcus radiotolerans SRS30216 = ATCC BAA-149]